MPVQKKRAFISLSSFNLREISFLVYVHRHCSYVRIQQEMGGLVSMPLNAVRQGLGRKGVDNALSKYLL